MKKIMIKNSLFNMYKYANEDKGKDINYYLSIV